MMIRIAMTATAVAFLAGLSGAAWSAEETRDAAVELCWMAAHKEYPKDSGNDENTSALAKDAYNHYAACMAKMGFKP